MNSDQLAALLSQLDDLRRECGDLQIAQETAKEQLRAAGLEADHFRQKFMQAVAGAKEREADLLAQIAIAADTRQKSAHENTVLTARAHELEKQLKKERSEFLKQERNLLTSAEKQQRRADQERLDRVKYEEQFLQLQKIDAEKITALTQLDTTLRTHEKELRLARHEAEVLRSRAEQAIATETKALSELKQLHADHALAVEVSAKQQTQSEREQNRLANLLATAVRERERENFLRQEETIALQRKVDKQTAQLTAANEQLAAEREKTCELQAALAEARHLTFEQQAEFAQRERQLLTDRDTACADRQQMVAEQRELEKLVRQAQTQLRETEKQTAQERRSALAQSDYLRVQMRQSLNVAARENEELLAQIDQLKKRAMTVAEREQSFDHELAAAREEARTREDHLQNELAAKCAALRQLSVSFQEETRRNQALVDQTASLRNLLAEREKKMQERQQDWQREKKNHEREITGWQEKLSEQTARFAAQQNESAALTAAINFAKEREQNLGGSINNLRQTLNEMQENVAASMASKAYYKEKYEAVQDALNKTRAVERGQAEKLNAANGQIQKLRDNYSQMEQQLVTAKQTEIQRQRTDYETQIAALTGELENLRVFRDTAAREINDERARNQEMLQNLLALRDELENAQSASVAGKNFLKEKLQLTETELAHYRLELAQERRTRQEFEQQLHDLRDKIEFA